MASRNPNSLTNQGEFTARKPRSEETDKHSRQQHHPGIKSSPSDSIPTLSAQTLTAGTAPPEKTYMPQTQSMEEVERGVSPLEGMPGWTSKELDTGMGKPVQGMTSVEMRHDGQHGRKKQSLGLAGRAGEDQGTHERQTGIERERGGEGGGVGWRGISQIRRLLRRDRRVML